MPATKSRTCLFVIALIAAILPGFSQNKLDSLEQELPNVSGKDSVDIMNNLGLNYAYSDVAKAKRYSNLALEKARQISYDEGEVTALINVGYSYYDHSNIDSALILFKQAVTRAEETGFDRGIGNANNALGNTYRETGNNVEAIKYYKEALFIQEKSNNPNGVSAALNNMGRALNSIGSYNEATEHLLRALKINQENGFDRKAALNLLGLAQIRLDQQEEALALDHLEEIRKMESLKEDLYIQTDLYNQLGFAHSRIGNYDEALAHFETCLELHEQYRQYPAVPLHNMADLYLSMGDKEKALQTALQALELKKTKNRELSSSFTLNLLSDIYLALGQPDKALSAGMEALDIVKRKNAKSRERKTSLDLAEVYQYKGNYREALKWRIRYEKLQDSLFTVQKASQQRAMLTLFETEKKQQQIVLQNAQIENQEIKQRQQQTQLYILIAGLLILTGFIALVLWGYFNLKKVKAKIQSQNEQLNQLNQTKDKFFGIIAHDLRSPLIGLQSVGNQIDYYLKKNQQEKLEGLSGKIEDTTKKLTDLLDNLLNWALLQNGMIPYHPEKVNLKEVVNSIVQLLAPLADMKQVALKNNIGEEASVYADSKAVHTILRNIISNALKYTDAGGEVVIDVSDQGDKSVITINDTGTGISAEQLPRLFELDKESVQGTQGEKGSGLGLILCKELVEMNNGSIEVKSDVGKGSSFIFHLPRYADAA